MKKKDTFSLKEILDQYSRCNVNDSIETIYLADNSSTPRTREILSTVIESRKLALRETVRWLLTALINSKQKNSVPYKIALQIKRGHGKTYLSHVIADILRDIVSDSKAAKDLMVVQMNDIAVVDIQAKEFIEHKGSKLFVLDGIPPVSETISHIWHCMRESNVVSLVSSPDEAVGAFGTGHIVVEVPDLNRDDILQIADIKGITKYSKKDTQLPLLIADMLGKDIPPKTIIELMSASSKVLVNKHALVTKQKELLSNILSEVIGKHSTVKLLGNVPIENIRDFLSSRVLGQEGAIERVVSTVAVARYGLMDKDRPVVSNLLIGPTGVGKTELSRALSEAIVGREEIIRIDMGEYKHPHHADKLFGSPPGYIGYGRDSKLISYLRKRNTGVILLDEIEKAHEDVQDGLLQVLDAGIISSGSGETFDVKRFFIMMTSNALADKIGVKKRLGFDGKNYEQEDVRRLLREDKVFSPEFINRIDGIILFKALSEEVARKIAIKEVGFLVEKLNQREISVTVKDDYYDWVVKTYDKKSGGRDIKRIIGITRGRIAMDLLEGNVRKVLLSADTEVELKNSDMIVEDKTGTGFN